MGLRRTSLVLYILFIFHIQHKFPSVSSRPSTVDTNHEALPFSASKPDVLGFEGKARELVVVIKRGGGGGRGGSSSRGGGGGSSSSRGGGGGRSSSRGGVIPVHTRGGGSSGSHSSSGSRNFRGTVYTVGCFAISVLAGLFLVQ